MDGLAGLKVLTGAGVYSRGTAQERASRNKVSCSIKHRQTLILPSYHLNQYFNQSNPSLIMQLQSEAQWDVLMVLLTNVV